MITLILVLIVIGVLLWLVEQYIPMDPAIKVLIRVVCLVVIVVYILRLLFGWPLHLP